MHIPLPPTLSLPLAITLGRIFLIPPFIAAFYWANPLVSMGLFALAALTDWLDGYLARRWQQTSALGAWLDPLADKLLVVTALVLLASVSDSPWLTVLAIIAIHRELLMSSLRGYVGVQWPQLTGAVAVSSWGKCKTVVQCVALLALLSRTPPLFAWGLGLFAVATLLALIALGDYGRRLWRAYRSLNGYD